MRRSFLTFILLAINEAVRITPRSLQPCLCAQCHIGQLPPALPVRLQHDTDKSPATEAALMFLRWYKQTISPLLPPGCRFIPTCSEYAAASFERYSIPQATILTAWRLLRCNPLHLPKKGCGVDEPTWPPPAYWAGDGRVRTLLDDELSRQRAMGQVNPPTPSPSSAPSYDPLGIDRGKCGDKDGVEEDRG
mmetsp:Transcript_22902/g.74133  ORF Transcript_22902/g.74133 Transcript_22902/m.74133 type:complete len:191 (-) Transcript_22902:456-1028(-)